LQEERRTEAFLSESRNEMLLANYKTLKEWIAASSSFVFE
jgi:hypothetical protein